ncbi:MAG TPA: hypothetical protein VKC17_01755 [Sphingomicrobium sp.]|nr:hypothetical protein [Sphingomicrobium sp.]
MKGEDFLAAGVALLGVLVTAGFGLYWNFRSAKANRKQPFLLKQLDLCHDVSLTAARLATVRGKDDWDAARQRFLELYWGPLSIVEDRDVKAAMENFGHELHALNYPPILPAARLEQPAYRLARAVRVLLLNSWSIQSLDRVLEERDG